MGLVGLMTLILQLPSFLNASSAEHRSYLLRRNFEWEPGEKPQNPIRKTEKENKETNENSLAL